MTLSIPEQDVRDRITQTVDGILAQNRSLSRRRPDSVEIDQTGIKIKLAMKARVENWADPDVNVEALIRLWAENGQARYALAKYDAHLDFPWYADLAHYTLFPAWLALLIREDNMKDIAPTFLAEGEAIRNLALQTSAGARSSTEEAWM